ncbi:MAG: SMC-Scp complex subunit ScpB [candidate division Zixibacteria bacterium]|nr:SMC-Scp complex subunit ScpB [candidate division Zixibacteria bacterium]
MIEEQYRASKIEALIMVSPEPLPIRRISKVINDMTPAKVSRAVADLNTGYSETGSSFRIREIAGGYQYYILPEYEGVVESLFARRRKVRLSRAALECMSIVAYRQPTTKTDIEHIRGVASDGVLRTLLEKGLIAITGRADTVGKPLQYGTTDEFLKFFGLASLDGLPKMEEIEQMISSEESRKQTELEFGVDEDGRLTKLNIVDGTFDPERREQLEDGIPEGLNDEIEISEPETETEAEPESEPDESSSLTLKRGAEEVGEALAVDDEKSDTVDIDKPVSSGAGQE